jgi:FkbM family methyltransferase
MKPLIHSIVQRFGYKIRKENAFKDMHSFLVGIENPIIFDVGAHQGHLSKHFRLLFPNSTVYAFEPFPESFEILRARTSSDPSIYAYNIGLANDIGIKPFFSNASTACNSLFPTDSISRVAWPSGLLETKEVLNTAFVTLDSVVADNKIRSIDILKLDVQGGEPLVMAGALEACKNKLIRLIYTEIIMQPTYQGQKRLDHFLSVFYESGFDLFNIYNLNTSGGGFLRQVDAIFVRKNDQ